MCRPGDNLRQNIDEKFNKIIKIQGMSNIINVYYVKVDHQSIYTKEEMWLLFIISFKEEVGVPWDQDLQQTCISYYNTTTVMWQFLSKQLIVMDKQFAVKISLHNHARLHNINDG